MKHRSGSRTAGGRIRAVAIVLLWAASMPSAGSAALTGRVVDAETGDAVAWASVGVPDLGLGTVADEDGRFEVAASGTAIELAVSAPGYETKEVVAAGEGAGLEIALRRVAEVVRERVTVSAAVDGRPGREIVLGRRLEPTGHGVGFASGQLGAQVGARIRVERPTLLRTAHFVVTHTRGDRFRYRVNLYAFEGDTVARNLLTENVVVDGPTERGTLTVDLSRFALVVDHDVLLALEWVADDERSEGVPPLMFRAKRGGRGDLYWRTYSLGPFAKVGRFRSGFYLTGYPLARD